MKWDKFMGSLGCQGGTQFDEQQGQKLGSTRVERDNLEVGKQI